ncbi:MAG: SDR family NAD(P)-dependent oxidoreductase [Agriterribacter sp.]
MKTALITGANQGIGFETARQLAKMNYYIYLGSRNLEKGLQAVEELKSEGLTNVELIEIDVTDTNSVKSARQIIESKTHKLDLLINNAGIAGTQPQNISTVSIENLKNIFETNFFGAVQTTQQFIALLKKSNKPTIINVSSPLGSLTMQSNSQNPNHRIYDAYSCSKTALNALTVLLARELEGINFRINSIEPGYTATNLNEYKGTQTVEQAAGIIIKYVLSESTETGSFFDREGNKLNW